MNVVEPRSCCFHAFRIDVDKNNRCATLSQLSRPGLAHAAATAGYDGHLSRECHFAPLSRISSFLLSGSFL